MMETTTAEATVSTEDPPIPLSVALMVVFPLVRDVASPGDVSEAIAGFEEIQVADEVRSLVLWSVKVPVATNCCFVPSAMEGLDGVTAIETRATLVTVRMADPETEPEVAEIVAVPGATLVASPMLPDTLLTSAIVLSELAHSTELVTS